MIIHNCQTQTTNNFGTGISPQHIQGYNYNSDDITNAVQITEPYVIDKGHTMQITYTVSQLM